MEGKNLQQDVAQWMAAAVAGKPEAKFPFTQTPLKSSVAQPTPLSTLADTLGAKASLVTKPQQTLAQLCEQIAKPPVDQTPLKSSVAEPTPLSTLLTFTRLPEQDAVAAYHSELIYGLDSTRSASLPDVIADSGSIALALGSIITSSPSLDSVSSLTGSLLDLTALVIKNKYNKRFVADYIKVIRGVADMVTSAYNWNVLGFILGALTSTVAVLDATSRQHPSSKIRPSDSLIPASESSLLASAVLANVNPIAGIINELADLAGAIADR
jgi:hypothetical protein